MSALYGIIFDVDGVIADSEAVNVRASAKVFAELFDLPNVKAEDFTDGIGRGAEAYMQAAASVYGLQMTEAQTRQAVQARQDNFLAILAEEPLPAFPGVRELMDEALALPDIGLAIATSSTREKSGAVLCSAQISVDKMVYVTGSDVTHKKPHPELFLTAASKLGIAPSRCLVFEDAPNGVQAAHAAGCHCVGITNTTTTEALSHADRVIDTLAGFTAATALTILGT